MRGFYFIIVVIAAGFGLRFEALKSATMHKDAHEKHIACTGIGRLAFMPAQAQLTHLPDSALNRQLGNYFLQGKVTAIQRDSFTMLVPQKNHQVLVSVKVNERTSMLTPMPPQQVKIEPVKLDAIHVGETVVVQGNMQDGVLLAKRVSLNTTVLSASDALIKPEDLGKQYIDGRVETVRADGLTIVWWNAQAKETRQRVRFDKDTSFRWGSESLTSRDIRVGDHISGSGELKDNVFVAKTLFVMTSQNPAKRKSQSAGIGLCGGGPVERGLKVADETVHRWLVGPRHSRRRHHSGTDLTYDLLPGFRAFRDVRQVGMLQGESAGFGLIAMTGNTILIQNGTGVVSLLRRGGRLQDKCSQCHTGNYE